MNGTGAAAGMNLAAWSHGEPVWGGGGGTHTSIPATWSVTCAPSHFLLQRTVRLTVPGMMAKHSSTVCAHLGYAAAAYLSRS